jgi:3-oxoacyl-[acyl-carrier protein] reductase
MWLQNKVAIVTGAATGIGEETANLLASEGAKVYRLDCDSAITSVENGIVCDVSSGASVATAFQNLEADILINNAGIYPRKEFLQTTEAEWDEIQNINLKSMFLTCKAALPAMIGRKSGKIVNISSVCFLGGAPLLVHYTASKGGVVGLTRALAREMGPHNINVNCVTPGAIKTEREKLFVSDELEREFVSKQCFARRIVPLDIAKTCLFLASSLSDAITGQTINVDGGWFTY